MVAHCIRNSQDAEPDVVVPIVVPVVVHVCESAVVTVAHNEPIVVTVGFSEFRVPYCTHPSMPPDKSHTNSYPVYHFNGPLFGRCLP